MSLPKNAAKAAANSFKEVFIETASKGTPIALEQRSGWLFESIRKMSLPKNAAKAAANGGVLPTITDSAGAALGALRVRRQKAHSE